ncbi:MAG: arginine--tRNA ligase [Phycisphaerae bacterium]|jgi:arginyl-tRNA synthetase
MKPVIDILEERIAAAMRQVTGQNAPAIVQPAKDAKFGDYQANGVMALAKKLKTNPRKLAEQVVEKLDLSDICEPPEIAGPGFINLRLKSDYIFRSLLEISVDSKNHLGISKVQKPQRIVVDFSGPNIAKQMHVGHLRSTIIGDSICRILEFLGHTVIPQNHIGDWGTQFGMLVVFLQQKIEELDSVEWTPPPLEDMERFYKQASEKYINDRYFASQARDAVVELHNGNKAFLELWKMIVGQSRIHYQQLYKQLQIKLNKDDERGESFYKDRLPEVVKELKDKGLAKISDGAVCVFPEGFKNKDGEPLPVIIQKSDGAYLYATTDLAAIRYRVNELKADEIIYVTDARQALHFDMVFTVAEMAGWAKREMLHHVTFGSVLGEDGKPLKTRSGENVKLKDLLDEAVERAKAVVDQKNSELPEKQKEKIANAVGIGAVKYADYSNNRTSDYVFSFDKMLAMEGNTAPYMQYAYARIKSIERKAVSKEVDIETELAGINELNLTEPAELDLAKHLLRYGEIIESAAADYHPNFLTAYLYELAQKFSSFYTDCPVLKAEPDKRPTRLLLCDLTAATIRHGLTELLGIEVVDEM